MPGGTVPPGAEPERNMAFDSLGEFVAALRRAGELAEVGAHVDPHLEISEITDRVVKAGGPALLFTSVKGSAYPVLTNQFGTERRMALAFGAASIEEVARRVRNAVKLGFPASLDARIAKVFSVGSAAFALPRTLKNGAPVHEVVEDDVDLMRLPVLTTWPLDGGPFVTLPLVFTKAARWRLRKTSACIACSATTARRWACTGKSTNRAARTPPSGASATSQLPSSIGADPAITYAATAPLPPIVDEISLAGFLRGRADPHGKVRERSDIKVPADAEFVLEGYVDNDELRVEGPFGDHTGVYSLADWYPTFHVTCITRRRQSDLRSDGRRQSRRWKTPGSAR